MNVLLEYIDLISIYFQVNIPYYASIVLDAFRCIPIMLNITVQLNLNLTVARMCANVACHISNDTCNLLSSACCYVYNMFLIKIILYAKYSQAQSLLVNTELSACIFEPCSSVLRSSFLFRVYSNHFFLTHNV